MASQSIEFQRHDLDELAVRGLEFNLQLDVRDGSTAVVVELAHHQMTTALHVVRFHGYGVARKQPVPSADGHGDDHEQHGTGHGHSRRGDFTLQGEQQLGCLLLGFPILEFLVLGR